MEKLNNKAGRELTAKVRKANLKPVIKELKTTKAMRKIGGAQVGLFCVCAAKAKP